MLALGIMVIVLGLALAPVIKQFVDDARTSASCAAPTDDWNTALCWSLDLIKVSATGIIILVGIALITAKGWVDL